MKLVYAEVIVNFLLAVFVALMLEVNWGVLYFISYVAVAFYVEDKLKLVDDRGFYVLGIMKDGAALIITILSNMFIAELLSFAQNVLSSLGGFNSFNAERMQESGEQDGMDILAESGEQLAKVAEGQSALDEGLAHYNDVFWGLTAIEVTVWSYILARVLLVLLLASKVLRAK